MSDGQPPEKKTVEFAKPPDWAIALTEKVSNGFAAVESRLDVMEANIELQGGSVKDISGRMTSLEARVGRVEERQETNSERAKSTTQTDHEHAAAIANIVTRLDAQDKVLEEQSMWLQTIHDSVTGFFTNKKVQFVGKVLFGLAMAYAAAKGLVPR